MARKRERSRRVPRWDAVERELWFGDLLLKRFGRPAPNVELILATFEEEGWPERIDDPLPPRANSDEATRLRNQVHALNKRLKKRLIFFYLDGTGKGICWKPL